MTTWYAPPQLGIGVSYHPALRRALDASGELIDFVEISPDILCHERIIRGQGRLEYHPTLLKEALCWSAPWPIVVHGLGLSIGTATGWNDNYVHILDMLHQYQPFLWHSEHLGFLLATTSDGRRLHAGVQLPLPFTEEALAVVAPRATALAARYSVPFLLENTTYYLPGLLTDGGRDEVAFLNDLTERSGCGLLLDLYNLHCNAVNFGFDALEALSRLRLDRVVEIHVAGGTTHDGFLMDVHSDVVPEAVWALLEWVVPRTPHLAGIVYELLDYALPIVGAAGIRRQLERIYSIWEHAQTMAHNGGTYALRELQTALGTLIATHAPDLSRSAAQRAWLSTLDLTATERAWLKQLLDTPGMRLTCTIQRWWRQMRLQQTVRLTLAALPPAQCLQVVQAYIVTVPCTSLFFIPEALQFLDFVLHTVAGVPHLNAVAHFEHALFSAREAEDTSVHTPPDVTALLPSQALHRHQAAALISFSAPPEQLLHALLQGLPVPTPNNRAYAVLVTPHLPHYWRPVTPDEAHLFMACHTPTTIGRLRTAVEHPARPLQALIDAGALCLDP